jgi:orotate phosphoribosyltransferase
MNPTRRARLIELLRTRSFERRRVTLASGRQSDFFIDCKQTALTAEGHALIGEVLFELLDQIPECRAVAGVELGGCPLASAVSLVSYQRGRPLDALYVRKERKDHGTAKLVEGDKSLPAGLPVALLEDVVTTGGSSLRAVRALEEAGAKVVGILALVDRQEGAREEIERAKLPFASVAVKRDFIADGE